MQNTQLSPLNDRNRLMFELSVYLHTVIRKLADNEQNTETPSKILFVLSIQQPTSLKTLCDIIGVTPSAGSILVDKYVKMNLIARNPDPSDRRKIVLSLTEEGTNLVNQGMDHLYQNLNNTLASLSNAENEEFCAALNLVHQYIHKLYPMYFKGSHSIHR